MGRKGSNELRVRDSILRLATRYQLDPNELLDAFIDAWKHGVTQQTGYTIACRHSNTQSGMFQITHDHVISQFPIDLTVLTRPDSFRHYFHEFKLEPIKAPSHVYLTIDELQFRMQHVNLKAKVVEKPGKRQDDTGSIRLSLWNHQIDTVNVGDTIDIRGGHVAQYAGNPQLRLGKKGTLSTNQGPLKTYN
jgi:hypothetical protein